MELDKNTKILILGGLGFLGGRVANHLKAQYPHNQIIISTTRLTYPQWANAFEVIQMDISQEKHVKKHLAQLKPEIIIHLAGVSQSVCQKNPVLAKKVNVEGMRYLAKYARINKVSKFIYSSTFQVYGQANELQGTITEETPLKPGNVYAQTKCDAEKILLDDSFKGMQRVIFRLSNAIGAPVDSEVAQTVWALAVNAFACSGLRDGVIAPLENSYRDFVLIEDVLQAIDLIIGSKFREDSCIFNLGSGQTLSIVEAAKLVKDVLKTEFDKDSIIIDPVQKDYAKFYYAIKKLKALGCNPTKDFSNGIKDVVKMAKIYLDERSSI